MTDKGLEFDPQNDAAGSGSIDLSRGDEMSPFDEIRATLYNYTRDESYDPDADPIDINEGIILVRVERSPETLSTHTTIEVKPSASEEVWTGLVGDDVDIFSVIKEGFTIKIFAKGDGDSASFEVPNPVHRNADPVLSVSKDRGAAIRGRRGELEAFAGGEYLNEETAERLAKNARDFTVDVISEAVKTKREKKADIEHREREKPIEIIEPNQRQVIDPEDIARFYSHSDRKALILVVDYSQQVPEVFPAIVDTITGSDGIIALCPIGEDGRVNGGYPIGQGGKPKGSQLRTYVLVGGYNPSKPIPRDQIMGRSEIVLGNEDTPPEITEG